MADFVRFVTPDGVNVLVNADHVSKAVPYREGWSSDGGPIWSEEKTVISLVGANDCIVVKKTIDEVAAALNHLW